MNELKFLSETPSLFKYSFESDNLTDYLKLIAKMVKLTEGLVKEYDCEFNENIYISFGYKFTIKLKDYSNKYKNMRYIKYFLENNKYKNFKSLILTFNKKKCGISKKNHPLNITEDVFVELIRKSFKDYLIKSTKKKVSKNKLKEINWKKGKNVIDNLIEQTKVHKLEIPNSIDSTIINSLLPYQINHFLIIRNALINKRCAFDMSDTGTGKTYVAAALAKVLELKPFVICPKAVITTWKKVFEEKFGITDYEIFTYGKIRFCNTEFIDRTENKRKKCKYDYKWNIDPDEYLVIYDEAHKLKNKKTQNFAIYTSLVDLDVYRLSLSATIAENLKKTEPIIYNFKDTITLETKKMSKSFINDFGKEVDEVTGDLCFNENYRDEYNKLNKMNFNIGLLHLHSIIYPDYGWRMKIAELGDQFPDTFIDAKTYNMGDKTCKEINNIYGEMEKIVDEYNIIKIKKDIIKLEDLKKKKNLDANDFKKMEKLEDTIEKSGLLQMKFVTEEHKETKNKDLILKRNIADGAILVQIVRARQRVEFLKCETLIELGEKFLDEDKSVAIFVNYNETLDYVRDHFVKKGFTPSIVRGGQSIKDRSEEIEKFQSDENRVIILNIQSGGVGISLHDLNGNYPRVSIISPSWSAQDLLQTFGRIHRAGGKSKSLQYVIFCANSIEEKIANKLKSKLSNIKQLNDGDLNMDCIIKD